MVVQSLWIGSKLTDMERLAINSHLRSGHEYHLYCYEDVEGVPTGTAIKDGREILPESEIFCYQIGEGKGSFSAFSNIFRYNLLHQRGGWWVDTDVVCLKPFDFENEYVFASERIKRSDKWHPTTCVFRTPAGSEFTRFCCNYCSRVDRQTLEWGTIGPSLLSKAVKFNCLDRFVVEPSVFCPIDWFRVEKLFENTPVDSHAVHLWNEVWRRKGLDKNDLNKGLYKKLKNDFLPTT